MVVTNVNHRAITKFFFIASSNHPKVGQQEIDELDSEKRSHNSTYAINQEVALEQSGGTQRAIAYAAERERNQSNDNECVKNDRGKNCGLRSAKVHNIQDIQNRKCACEHRRNNGEVFGDIVGDGG